MPGEWDLIGRLAITLALSAAVADSLDPMVEDLRVLDGVLTATAEAEDAD